MLGVVDPEAIPSAGFGAGDGFIFLDKVNCSGQELMLTGCLSDGDEIEDCYHYQDAGVSCPPDGM